MVTLIFEFDDRLIEFLLLKKYINIRVRILFYGLLTIEIDD